MIITPIFSLFLFIPFTLLFFCAFILTVLWAWSILGSHKAPYVPLPPEALPGICDALQIAKGSVVYDMGCGDGRILFLCAEKHPDAHYIGIEKALFPHMLSLWRMSMRKASPFYQSLSRAQRGKGEARGEAKTTFLRTDMFSISVEDADRIVLYLLPGLMGDVLEKLRREVRPGTRVVAVDFPFTPLSPSSSPTLSSTIEQTHLPLHMRGRMLYVYTF